MRAAQLKSSSNSNLYFQTERLQIQEANSLRGLKALSDSNGFFARMDGREPMKKEVSTNALRNDYLREEDVFL